MLLSTAFDMLPGIAEPATEYEVILDGKTVAAGIFDRNEAYALAASLETADFEAGDYPRTEVRSCSRVDGGWCYFVLPYKLPEMEKRFQALGKRAEKNGRPAPSYRVVGTRTEMHQDRDLWGIARARTEIRTIVAVQVSDVTLRDGWRFIATLDRVGSANIVRCSPAAQKDGVDVPETFRTRFLCDHCATARKRSSTYLFRHSDGSWMQTGTNCAADVFGEDSGAEVAYWASYERTVSGGWADEDSFGSNRPRLEVGTFEALLSTALHVKAYGWTSRKAAGSNESTADLAFRALTGRGKDVAVERAELLAALDKRGVTLAELTEPLTAEVNATIAWASTLDGRSEYAHNLKVSVGAGYVNAKLIGIVASAYPAWLRVQEREVERRRQAAMPRVSEHIAPVGTKFGRKAKGSLPAMPVTVIGARNFASDFGVRTLVTMQDEQGRIAKWWASGGIEVRKGATYLLSGTVSKCEDYKGSKETTLSRCELHETDETKEDAARLVRAEQAVKAEQAAARAAVERGARLVAAKLAELVESAAASDDYARLDWLPPCLQGWTPQEDAPGNRTIGEAHAPWPMTELRGAWAEAGDEVRSFEAFLGLPEATRIQRVSAMQTLNPDLLEAVRDSGVRDNPLVFIATVELARQGRP